MHLNRIVLETNPNAYTILTEFKTLDAKVICIISSLSIDFIIRATSRFRPYTVFRLSHAVTYGGIVDNSTIIAF